MLKPLYKQAFTDFNPSAVMFKPHQFWQIMWSNAGIALWLAGLFAWASHRGVWEVLSLYVVPYLWYVFMSYYCRISC